MLRESCDDCHQNFIEIPLLQSNVIKIDNGIDYATGTFPMTAIAWIFVLAAIALQTMNIVWAVQGISRGAWKSQVTLVPCLLWYIGLMFRSDAFFFSSKGIEISIVLVTHLALTGLMAIVFRLRVGRNRHHKS